MLFATIQRVAPIAGLLALLCAPIGAANAEQTQGGLTAGPPPAAPASILQVAGTAERITISATHADVLSALKLVFAQAHKQFAPDTSVFGEVTLELTNQSFATVLDALCNQTFLRYDIDAHGIYRFSRDERKIQEAFVRLRVINASVGSYLRGLGIYNAPLGTQNAPSSFGAQAPVGAAGPAGSPGGSVRGGFGGGVGASANGKAAAPALLLPKASINLNGAAASQLQEKVAGDKQRQTEAGAERSPAEQAVTSGGQQNVTSLGTMTAYDRYLQANGLVGVHAPSDKPVPVVSVLHQFSRQSDIPINIDSVIPKGLSFRFSGDLVKPLPEALNLLSAVAHLEWRQANGQIFVTTTPDFQIFYGDSNVPRATYPPASTPMLRTAAPARPRATPMPSAEPRKNMIPHRDTKHEKD